MNTFIWTYHRNKFDFVNLEESVVAIEDIAYHLSAIPRFTGAINTNFSCSVAEHSLRCAIYAEEVLGVEKSILPHYLLHDAAEAYMNDIATPVKALIPQYKELEQKVQDIIMRKLGLWDEEWLYTHPQHDLCKRVDHIALIYEGRFYTTAQEWPERFRVEQEEWNISDKDLDDMFDIDMHKVSAAFHTSRKFVAERFIAWYTRFRFTGHAESAV